MERSPAAHAAGDVADTNHLIMQVESFIKFYVFTSCDYDYAFRREPSSCQCSTFRPCNFPQ
jgi:hypothetical protein